QESSNGIIARAAAAHQPIEPREAIAIRTATMADLKFIDDLQKKHAKMVGFMHRRALESYIEGGDVLVAESCQPSAPGSVSHQEEGTAQGVIPVKTGIQGARITPSDQPWTPACAGVTESGGSAQGSKLTPHGSAQPLGYIIGKDRYF